MWVGDFQLVPQCRALVDVIVPDIPWVCEGQGCGYK